MGRSRRRLAPVRRSSRPVDGRLRSLREGWPGAGIRPRRRQELHEARSCSSKRPGAARVSTETSVLLPPDCRATRLCKSCSKANRSGIPNGRSRTSRQRSFGHYYREMLKGAYQTLADKDTMFPELAGREVELAGFVWFQGWNDMISEEYTAEYTANMVRFIRDVRRRSARTSVSSLAR
ncbi:MAG: sialate O-acetylesterase [Planctomycetaceae bacterium]